MPAVTGNMNVRRKTNNEIAAGTVTVTKGKRIAIAAEITIAINGIRSVIAAVTVTKRTVTAVVIATVKRRKKTVTVTERREKKIAAVTVTGIGGKKIAAVIVIVIEKIGIVI